MLKLNHTLVNMLFTRKRLNFITLGLGSSLLLLPVINAKDKAILPDGTAISQCEFTIPSMACIPGGPFIRGSNLDTHLCTQEGRPKMKKPDTHPEATIHLQTFYMDETEVTYSRYMECVKTKNCKYAGPLYNDFNRPNQPHTGATWYDAAQYCKAQGKHLPTEAEWEKAARGEKGNFYPWGNSTITCENSVFKDKSGRSCGIKKKGKQANKGRVLEVKSRPAGNYGLYDMSGNAEEWVYDWYTKDYSECGEKCLGVNPKGPCDGALKCKGYVFRGVRGGSWYWEGEHATGYHRRPHYPNNKNPYHHFGFRCAASIEEASKIANSK